MKNRKTNMKSSKIIKIVIGKIEKKRLLYGKYHGKFIKEFCLEKKRSRKTCNKLYLNEKYIKEKKTIKKKRKN